MSMNVSMELYIDRDGAKMYHVPVNMLIERVTSMRDYKPVGVVYHRSQYDVVSVDRVDDICQVWITDRRAIRGLNFTMKIVQDTHEEAPELGFEMTHYSEPLSKASSVSAEYTSLKTELKLNLTELVSLFEEFEREFLLHFL